MSITKKVEELKSTLSNSSPLSTLLQKSFLSEKEIVKKIISVRTPSLSLSDIDVMLDGGQKNLLFDNIGNLAGQAGNLGNLAGQAGNLGNLVGQVGNIGNLSGQSGNLLGQAGNLGNLAGQVGNIGNLTGQVENIGNLSGQAGNLLGQSGNLGNLAGQVGNIGNLTVQFQIGDILQQFSALKNVPGPETVYSLINKSKSAVESGIFPINQLTPYFDEAKDMKQRVLVCVTMLSTMQISLLQELIRISIQIGTSITGMAILVAPMSFNVPAAISMLLLIVDQLSNICKTILSCLPFLDCLKLLDFVIDNAPNNPVVTGLEVVITFLTSIYKFCSILKKFIDTLFEALSKLLGKGKGGCEKEKRKYNRKKRKLIKEIREILGDSNFGGNPYFLTTSEDDEFYFPELEAKIESLIRSGKISEDDADSARDIQDEIKSFDDRIRIVCDFEVPETINGDIDIDKIELNNEVFQTLRDIKGVTDAIAVGREKFVYDAELPDGTILKDLTLEEIKDLQEKFDVIFKTNENPN
jgi:hypothetical protein